MDPKDFTSKRAGEIARNSEGDWVFLPHPLPPVLQYDESMAGTLAAAHHAIGELAGLSRRLPNPKLFVRPFIRQEAALSSKIEGTHSTFRELLMHEAGPEAKRAGQAESTDVQQVANYADALEYGLKQLKNEPVRIELLNGLHAHLMSGMRGDIIEPGLFREEQNFIGSSHRIEEALYVPPPSEKVVPLLRQLESYIRSSSAAPALLRIALVHYQFEAIHPFLDGNGRVGRLLMTLLMAKWDLLPYPILNISIYLEKNRQAYMRHLLAISQRGEWEEWILFFLRGATLQSGHTIDVIQKLENLRMKWHDRMIRPRMPSHMPSGLDFLFGMPVFQVGHLQKALKLQYPAAQRIVWLLEDEGIVKEQTGQERNRIYAAQDILNLLDENSR
jgi:Fic family protein